MLHIIYIRTYRYIDSLVEIMPGHITLSPDAGSSVEIIASPAGNAPQCIFGQQPGLAAESKKNTLTSQSTVGQSELSLANCNSQSYIYMYKII